MILAGTAAPTGNLFGEILPWLVALVAFVCVGAAVIYALRRMLSDRSAPSEGFTLQDLRDMHASGKLSDEEFERARSLLLERASRTEGTGGDDAPRDE